MGKRVDAASNVKETRDLPNGNSEEVVYCANCGDDEGGTGYGTLDFVENRWIEVDGALVCNVYCAAIQSGMSETQAQLARGMKARMDAARDGLMTQAQLDADEERVNTMLAEAEMPREERTYPLAGNIDEASDEDTHEHGLSTDEDVEDAANEGQDDFDAILAELERGDS